MVKPVRVYFKDENTYKTFGVGDDVTVGDLHKMMKEKLEKSDEEARKFGVVEKKPDGERFPDVTEKVVSLLNGWEKEKKKGKSENDFQFWWKEKPSENKTIRVHFLDGTYKAVVVNTDTTASILHEAVTSKIELSNDTNFGLFDVRKKGERPLPSNENIFAIMDDWKKNAKKGDKEDENRFVFKLKSPMKGEDVVEDPVRVHLLYLESRNDMMNGLLTPSTEEMTQLTALEVQIHFGDNNPKVHVEGFLVPKLKELIPKKILASKKEKEWEKEVYKQHTTHKGMPPLFAKLEYLQILHRSFRASASIVAINKAEQTKRDEEDLTKRAKAAAAKAALAAPAAPAVSAPTPAPASAGVKPAAGGPPPPPPPPPPAPPAPKPKEGEEDINAFPSRAELTATTVSARVSTRFDLLNSIEGGASLKRVEINDRSAPKLESVKIKKSDRQGLLKEIGEGADLKKAETVDKSAPKVEGVKVKKVDRKSLLDGIETEDKKLKHIETVDKSSPKFTQKKVDRDTIFEEIEKGEAQLKHAETVDKSTPVLEKVKVKKIDRKGILEGIEKGVKLKKSETKDSSAPVIDENTKVDVGARSNLLASIEEGVLLKRVTDADKIPKGEGVIRKPKKPKNPNKPPKPPAAPGAPPPPPKPPIAGGKIPPPPPPPPPTGTHSTHLEVMQSIEKGATKLKKTETVDRSGPNVASGEVKIKKLDRKALLTEIEGGGEEGVDKKLKKADTVDKSAPLIEGVKVKKIDRKGMLDSIEKGDVALKHTETIDKSTPKISKKKVDPDSVIADIAKGEPKLKHTETVDKSSPIVERVKIKKLDRNALLRGIEAGIDLKNVDEVHDASAPLIEADATLKKEERPRAGLLQEIEKGAKLKKLDAQ